MRIFLHLKLFIKKFRKIFSIRLSKILLQIDSSVSNFKSSIKKEELELQND